MVEQTDDQLDDFLNLLQPEVSYTLWGLMSGEYMLIWSLGGEGGYNSALTPKLQKGRVHGIIYYTVIVSCAPFQYLQSAVGEGAGELLTDGLDQTNDEAVEVNYLVATYV